MRVFVHQGDMVVPVLMGLVILPFKVVGMLVVLVMDVAMVMRHRLMAVLVFMVLRQMQPDAPAHQSARQPEGR